MDNVHAATLRLENIPVPEGPAGEETRRAIEMLKTAMTQQALYPTFPDASRLHSTPFNSGTRSRHGETNPANSTSARRRELERNRANVPTASQAQLIVDQARERREREAARAREVERNGGAAGGQPQPTRAHTEVTSPGASPSLTGPECLSDAIRSESFPSDFKEPRKVPNYEPNMDPTSWLSTYEMAMSIRNATGNLCARFMYLMMEGPAKVWMRNLPPRSINSWEQLKTAFIQNFQGTCKKLSTIEDLRDVFKGRASLQDTG
jgi:hypothetical protein